MKGRITRLVLASLMAVVPAVVIAAPPASADDGIPGTFVLWQEGTGGRCMVPNSLAPGAVVVSWIGCEGANYPDMLWESSPLGNGAYELRNDANRSLCLAVPNGSKNARAIVAVCNGDIKQQWHEDTNEFKPDWGDRMLRNGYSGYCLTREGTTQWSDPVVQWNCDYPWFTDMWWYFHTYH
jgi:hypothetical protein